MNLSSSALLSCVVLCLALSIMAQEPTERFEKVATRLIEAINTENYVATHQDFSQDMSKAFPLEKSTPFFKDLLAQLGKIQKYDPPRLVAYNQSVSTLYFEKAKLDMKLVLNDKDQLIGLWFLPHRPPTPVPTQHQTALRLPCEGEWYVFWGGDTKDINQHHDVIMQRYAFDFVIMDNNGKTYQGDGKKNEDYFCFGKPIVAPADGVITEVIHGVRDNTPGSMNPYSALGNAIILEHRQYEVSVIAHFKQGSICVKAGDQVKRGQLLGLCGNSGNSSEPHIHYHLQNTAIIQDGTGIRCRFDQVIVTKIINVAQEKKIEAKTDYSPIKGDRVQQQE